jgi:DNA repair protein RadA
MEIMPSELEQIDGIGPTVAQKLEECGFRTIEGIAAATVKELTSLAGIGAATAQKIIESAQRLASIGIETADKLWKKRQTIERITTSSRELDALLGGGIETGSMTEFAGAFRSGKTQICHQICVNVQMPAEQGGCASKAAYIDTEGTFRPERIINMAQTRQLDPKQALKNILVGRAYNSDHQMLLVQQIQDNPQFKEVKLLIVDSLIGHFRAEYLGRGMLAERQQKLNKHLHDLLRLAEVNNIAVVTTNQVHAQPDVFFGAPDRPTGGHIVAHAAQTRVYLRKSKGERRIATLIDSPYLPEGEALFTIVASGIADA